MNIFFKYLKPIHLAGDSHPISSSAYRLDGTGKECNLRADAEANNCNCCDYFTFDKYGSLILIEDTRLRAIIQAKNAELKFLKDAPRQLRDQYIKHVIVMENVVKVYGSLFVLYKLLNMRLNSNSSEVFPSIESIQFWLVANDSELWAEKSWEHYKLVIENGLYGRLGHNFIRSVKVIRKDRLSDALSRAGTG